MSQITNKPSPLGRGLSALFGDADASYQPNPVRMHSPEPEPHKSGAPRVMPLTFLQPGAFQPRRYFDEDALKGLTESIKERGILEPIVVRLIAGSQENFEIVAGERRWRAAQRAGLHDVPVIVRSLSDREALEYGLIENVQRQDLSPLEEAEGYKRLLEEFSHTQEDLAKIVGKSRPHITNMLRILGLPAGVKQMIEKGELTLGHARAIVTARDPLELAQEIVKKGLNVRQAEALAKRLSENPQIHNRKTAPAQDADTAALEKDLERATGLKAKINAQGKTGSVTFYYHELEQLQGLIDKLKA
jgi:ParB family chromosome partitioning protein